MTPTRAILTACALIAMEYAIALYCFTETGLGFRSDYLYDVIADGANNLSKAIMATIIYRLAIPFPLRVGDRLGMVAKGLLGVLVVGLWVDVIQTPFYSAYLYSWSEEISIVCGFVWLAWFWNRTKKLSK